MVASLACECAASGKKSSVWDGPVFVVEDFSQQRLSARRLAAALEQAGWPAQLLDLAPELADAAGLISLVQQVRPRLLVFSILFASHLPATLALLAALRRAGVASHLTLTGHLPFFAATELLAACPALDSVVAGEAEVTVVALAASLPEGQHGQAIPGLVSRGPAGGVARTPPDPPGRLHHPLAFPNQGAGHSGRTGDAGVPAAWQPDPLPTWAGVGFATIEASRGCYHACAFCLPCAFYRAAGLAYELRDIPHLVDEIEALYQRGARLFLFDDEQFLPPRALRSARVAALCAELARRHLTIAFTLKCRADDVEAELFKQLQAMGLLRVYVGLESGSQATLDDLAKGVRVGDNLAALAILAALGIVADFRCLLFHPWSTWEAVAEDLTFYRQVTPLLTTLLDWREVEVYPGTRLAQRLRDEGRAVGDPWPLLYTAPDVRAELLRRMGRAIMGPASIYRACQGEITRAWFEHLLARRFRPSDRDVAAARQLQAAVQEGNLALLAIWQEMLAFAAQAAMRAAARVNAAVTGWAARVSLACLDIQHALAVRPA